MRNFVYRLFKKRDKLYWGFICIIFLTIIISQVLMRKSGMMGYFSAIETFEGEFISNEEMFNKEEVVLEFMGEIPQTMPEIYLNGERIGFFDQKKKTVIVETDSVIEVFCEESPEDAKVNVKWDDKKVTNYIKPYPVILKKGFNIVARVLFL